ncbi:MAG: IS110 family transposase [Clostridia bacterium]|nr:IS110 family transposase [Clostridia bacterium]
MYAVGIDVAKAKSMVSILSDDGEIIKEPFEILNTESGLSELCEIIKMLDDKAYCVVEATSIYHFPVVSFLQENSIFVSVVNPLVIKKYASMDIRKVKTDKADSLKLASYVLDNHRHLVNYSADEQIYAELRVLSRQYLHYVKVLANEKVNLTDLLDRTLPGIKPLLKSTIRTTGKNKLCDFVSKFWHCDVITNMSENKFVSEYIKWAKKKGYHPNETKAKSLYANALECIPTLSSNSPSTKMLVLEAAKAVSNVETTLATILAQMSALAKSLPEFSVVRSMPGVGDVLAPRIIAEIGDVRKFHSASALIAYAGIDTPPYESGSYSSSNRKITKRGSASLRKTGYEIMQALKIVQPQTDNAVYQYLIKKENEGKPLKVAKIAALNKFLRIYYARVKEQYSST